MQHYPPQAGRTHPRLASLHPPWAQEKFMVLCTSLSRSWSPGRCLPYFQLWDFSADSPKVPSWLAKPCHETEHGISPSLLNADRLWPSQVKLECVFAKDICSDSQEVALPGATLSWCRAPDARIHSQHIFSSVLS